MAKKQYNKQNHNSKPIKGNKSSLVYGDPAIRPPIKEDGYVIRIPNNSTEILLRINLPGKPKCLYSLNGNARRFEYDGGVRDLLIPEFVTKMDVAARAMDELLGVIERNHLRFPSDNMAINSIVDTLRWGNSIIAVGKSYYKVFHMDEELMEDHLLFLLRRHQANADFFNADYIDVPALKEILHSVRVELNILNRMDFYDLNHAENRLHDAQYYPRTHFSSYTGSQFEPDEEDEDDED